MTSTLVKPVARRVETPGDTRPRRRNIEREAEERLQQWKEDNGGNAETGGGIVNSGVIGGVLAMVAAVIWFFAGIVYLDMIYFYPPILFVLGLAGLMKGMLGGLK